MKKTLSVLMSIGFLFSFPLTVFASTYTVVQGDTLFKIARQYNSTPDELIRLNQLPNDRLAIGQALIVPGGDHQTEADIAIPADVFGQPAGSSEPVFARVNVPTLNVRQQPSTESPILSKVTYGMKLEVIESRPDWTSIKLNGQIAFVATPYLSPDSNVDQAAKHDDLVQINGDAEVLLKLIEPLLGIPYRLGGTTTDGFDCSGFTSYVMNQLGVTLPRTSEEQFLYGQEVPFEQAQPGDLLFYDTLKKGKVSHVALYLGNGMIVHANGEHVRLEKVEYMHKLYPFYGVKRYVALP
jgi:peptidoglycan endopeptidase LytE